MELRELKIFNDIAQEKSFVKAAYLNYLTQPSISSHLKRLEEDLGVKLFDRAPRKVALTKDGELLLPHVQELLLKCENLKTLAAQRKHIKKGDIRLATIHSIGIYELAPVLKKFMRTYPDIHIHLQYFRSDIIYDHVLKNTIDLGLVSYPESRAKIQVTPFANDHMVLIVAPHHRLAKRRSVPLESIQGENFVAFDKGIPTRDAIDEVFRRKKIQVSIRTTNENIDTLKKAVEVGLGVSIVPCKTVREEARKGTVKCLKILDAKLDRPLGILTLKERILSEPVQLFIRMLTANPLKTLPSCR